MPLSIPTELKKIAPYIKRAEELDRDKSAPESRLVAYYCRQYAVQLGIPVASQSASAKACLGEILGDLEKEKPAMDNFTRDESAFLCRKFAEAIFNRADSDDRSGNAGKATAKTFYAAASFLQMLEQFRGDDEGETDEQATEDKKRIVYSKWKATEILKAIKEGRTPTPGGYGEEEPDNDEAEEDEEKKEKAEEEEDNDDDAPPTVETVTDEENDTTTADLPPPPAPAAFMPPPLRPPPPAPTEEEENDDDEESDDNEDEEEQGTEVTLGPPPAYPGGGGGSSSSSQPPPPRVDRPSLTFDLPSVEPAVAARPSKPAKSSSGGVFGFGKKKKSHKKVTNAMITDASELTRFALAALEDKNADLAAERLQQALEALGR